MSVGLPTLMAFMFYSKIVNFVNNFAFGLFIQIQIHNIILVGHY